MEEVESDEIHIFFKEIQSDEDLTHEERIEDDKIEAVESLISGITRKTGTHELNSLNCGKNIPKWSRHLIENFPEFNEEYVEFLVDDFSRKMKTSAKGPGKYVIVILREKGFLVCHADAGEKTLTTSLDVIDRLMDSDNIDKYAEFYERDSDIWVDHFERNKTQSFTEWLGIPQSEVVFDTLGNIKGYTELEGLTAIFEFEEEDIVKKIIESDDYRLEEGSLKTPNGKEFPLERIQWGRTSFEDIGEFKQKLSTIYYDLDTYHQAFIDLHGSSRPYFDKFIDRETKLINSAKGETEIVKKNENFNISFSSAQVDTRNKWLTKLVNHFLEGQMNAIYHAGSSATKQPYEIGPFSFFNDLGIDDYNWQKLQNLYTVVDGVGTDNNLQRIVGSAIFLIMDELTDSKSQFLFQEISESMMSRVSEGVVVQREGECHGLEFKAGEWIENKDVESISEEMVKELEGDTNLLIIGIDEEAHQINPMKSTDLKSEFRERIEEETESPEGSNIEAIPLPITPKETLLICFKNGDTAIETAPLMDVLEAPATST